MTIVNSVNKIGPGFGSGGNASNIGIALSGTGQQTNTIPASGSFILAFFAGQLRIKFYDGAGTAPAGSDVTIQASDGTNTVTLANFHPGTAVPITSTGYLDLNFDLLLD